MLIFAMVICPLPKRLYLALRKRALPTHMPQKHYPALMLTLRFLYLAKRAADHLLSLDLTVLSGAPAHILWRMGIIGLWQKYVLPRFIPKAVTPAAPIETRTISLEH